MGHQTTIVMMATKTAPPNPDDMLFYPAPRLIVYIMNFLGVQTIPQALLERDIQCEPIIHVTFNYN
jgi:hypothetical protein